MVPTNYSTLFCSIIFKKDTYYLYKHHVAPFITSSHKKAINEEQFTKLTGLSINNAINEYYPEYLI